MKSLSSLVLLCLWVVLSSAQEEGEAAAPHGAASAPQPVPAEVPVPPEVPPMTPWLHLRIEEVVLALGWIPRTPGGQAGPA
jgi:hypothetical protein